VVLDMLFYYLPSFVSPSCLLLLAKFVQDFQPQGTTVGDCAFLYDTKVPYVVGDDDLS
jgi:hypothetical protein